MKITPNSIDELLERARSIAGSSLDDLAIEANISTPNDLKRDKGWIGQLLEWHLGAPAGSQPTQDFEHLGVELKTLPISYTGSPLETTFVCVAPLIGVQGLTWETSHVRQKLSCVLWVPVQGEREIPLGERRIGFPFLWSPSPEEEEQLRQDWEELMEMIVLGNVNSITARVGEVMQIRPKAANGKVKTDAYGETGKLIKAQPKGFYLRKNFTQHILNHVFNHDVK
ncbi:DNA mismatch repair endonuclease MutH [Vibrio sp.]|nr:DNA mismatch repair endonuclease MutH [Vibrio sp.]